MGYKGKFQPGDLPGYGAIFMSNTGTKKECFQRKLFGLPIAQSNFVLHVKKGMILFLFEFEKRQLHGVYRATSNGEIDIEPNAFRSSGKCFPAQVPFTTVWNCRPLVEHEFKDAIRDNYFSWKKFKFGLSKDQVYKLMTLFHTKRISKNDPPKTSLRYEDKPSDKDIIRFGNDRKKVRDRNRIKFIKEEDGHGFDIDEVKEVDNHAHGYRSLMKDKERVLTKCKKEHDDFSDCGRRKLDKRFDRSLRGLRRVSDTSLNYMSDINNVKEMQNNFSEINGITNFTKIKVEDGYGRFGKISVASIDEKILVDRIANKNRIQDEYHVINGFRQNHSALNDFGGSPDRGNETIVDGWFFHNGTLESQQRTLTDYPLSKPKPKGVIDVCQNPNYEPRTSPFEPRGTNFGINFGSDRDFGNICNQNNSDFIPISVISEQFPHPFEFNNIDNTYEHRFPNSTSYDPSMITTHAPYDPELPDFCQRRSYFTPGPDSSPTENSRSKKYVRKVSVFDRLASPQKTIDHEQKYESDEKSELDASVNEVMKMLERIVSSPKNKTEKRQSSFEQDDDDHKIVDYELPNIESDVVNIEYEGIEGDESIIQETRVADFKRRKKTHKNSDEVKESSGGNTSGTDWDVGPSCKRRKLVRPVFVKKEFTTFDEITPLRKVVESVKNIEGEKSTKEGDVCAQVEENENGKNHEVLEKSPQESFGFDDMAVVGMSRHEHKMCGWIEE